MPSARRIARVVIALAIVGSSVGIGFPAAHAAPSVETLSETLASIAERNEGLTERFNAAQIDVDAALARYRQTHAASQKELHVYEQQRRRLQRAVAALYLERAINPAAAIFMADSGARYVQTVNALDAVSRAHDQQLSLVTAAQNRYDRTDAAAKAALAVATARRDDLQHQRDVLEREQKKALDLLETLTASERAEFFAGPASLPANVLGIPSGVQSTNPAGNIAVHAALAQLGKPYVWAAAGPGTFDCSGLTMFAWHAAGVSLPHLASAQFRIGRHIEPVDLQPGDLVFFYPTIEHVGMYIGNGMMVHAPQTGDVVRIVPVNRFAKDYMGATRPNG